MNIYRILKGLSAALALSVSLSAHAVPFVNGDFSSGSTGWNDASFTGTAGVVGGQAQLENGVGTDPFSAVFVQGDDGSFSFLNPITLASNVTTLTFDASFVDLGVDATETGSSSFFDELFVAVYDALDFNLDLIFATGIDINKDNLGFMAYGFDVSSLAGRNVALSFELSDENDGFDSRVLIDNVVFNTATASVPEPGTLYLLSLGLLLVIVNARRQKSGV